MEKDKNFLNEQGISLVEIMISLAILAIAQLAMMKMSETQNKSAKTTEAKFETAEIVNNIRSVLASNQACRNTFGSTGIGPGGVNPPYTGTINANTGLDASSNDVITEIRNSNNQVVFSEGGLIPGTQVTITSLSLDSSVSPANTIPVSGTGQTHLVVTLNRTSDVFGAEEVTRRILLTARVDGSQRIEDCSGASVSDSLSAIAAYVCSSMGGTWFEPGRGGTGDCQDMDLNGYITLSNEDHYQAGWTPANYNNGKGFRVDGTSYLKGNTVIGESGTTNSVLINGPTQFEGNISVDGNLAIENGHWIDILSDKRLKYNIEDLKDSNLDKLNQVKTVSYVWRNNEVKDIGFIAQNIQNLYPELVHENEEGFLSVKYNQMIPISINAIKNLSKKIKKQEKIIFRLKSEKIKNEKRFKTLEERLKALEARGDNNG